MQNRTNTAAALAKEKSTMTPATPSQPDGNNNTDPDGGDIPIDSSTDDGFSKFFGKFKPTSYMQSECLSDAQLISVSEEKDQEKWDPHVKTCGRCKNVVNLLMQSESKRISLDEFLANASKQVRQSRKEMRPASYWRAFYHISSAWQVTVAVVIAVVVFGLIGWWYVKNSQPVSHPQYAVVIPADDSWRVKEWLRTHNSIADDPSLPVAAKIARFKTMQGERAEINQKLKSITRGPLEASERAELAQLVSTYNSEIKILNAAIQSGNVTGETQHLEMEPNRDSTVVSIVVLTITSDENPTLLGSYTFQGSQKQDVELARTIVKGSKQLNFTALANNDVEVHDLSFRSETDLNRITGRLEQLKQEKGIVVKFVSTPNGFPRSAFGEKKPTVASPH